MASVYDTYTPAYERCVLFVSLRRAYAVSPDLSQSMDVDER